jgi:hypothetical protein
LWDDNGVKVVEMDRIKQVAEQFYKKLLGNNGFIFDEPKKLGLLLLFRAGSLRLPLPEWVALLWMRKLSK